MKTLLNVPYAEKDEAKRLGAKWDTARKVWFVEDLDDLNPFLKWMNAHLTQPFDSLFPPAIPPKHTRPDSKQPGKKANKERLRTEREALRNKYSKSKSIGPNSPAIVQECPQTSE